MPTPTVRISEASHRVLREVAEKTGDTMVEILDKALDDYRRKLFFQMLNKGYALLRADPLGWAALKQERNVWDATLMDGLNPEERWGEDRRPISARHRKRRSRK
jgi:hypothetical protein